MNYKIINGKVLSIKNEHVITEDKTLYIKDSGISFIPFEEGESFEVIDAARHLIMPGLINMHTHAYMTQMRNYADDVDFVEWLFNRVSPVEDKLPLEGAYWTNQLAFMEMLQSGTTSYVDMHMYANQSARAASDVGMRAFIGRGLVGEDLYTDGYSRFRDALKEKELYESDTIKFILSPHAIYSCSNKLMQQVSAEAEKLGLLKQTHLSEGMTEINDCLDKYGKTPVKLLADLGFLDDRTILAHCVQIQGDDIEIIKNSGAHVVTNPASNAKLGNGFAPILDMKEAGINVCIGTDGTASNNTLNMFREMTLTTLIHKGIARSSTAMPSDYVVQCATTHAAKALSMENQIGNIVEGAAADLIFLDLDAPSMFPNNNVISALCYSANGSEVDTVMINGRILMKNREFLTIDKERVYYEVQKIVDTYL